MIYSSAVSTALPTILKIMQTVVDRLCFTGLGHTQSCRLNQKCIIGLNVTTILLDGANFAWWWTCIGKGVLLTRLSNLYFHRLGPLGRVSHRVNMSICMSSPSQETYFDTSHWLTTVTLSLPRPLIGQPSQPPLPNPPPHFWSLLVSFDRFWSLLITFGQP